MITVPADPTPYEFDPARTALVCIDFQRDFVEPGGFGETLGNDVSTLRSAIAPTVSSIGTLGSRRAGR